MAEEKLEIEVTADTKQALAGLRGTGLAAGAMGGAVVAGAMFGLKAIKSLISGVVDLSIKLGKLAVESAIDFESAVLKARTMLDLTGDEVKVLNELLEEQAKTWGITAIKQANAQYLIGSGLTKDLTESQLALTAANKLAVVGFDELEGSTASMITVMRATGADISRVDEIAQKLWATVRAGMLDTADLEGATGKLASAFKFVPFEEVMAAFAILTAKLGGTEIAATSLNRLILALTETDKKGAKAAKKLGIEFGITALKEKGFLGILKELNKVFETDIQAWKSTVPEMRAFRAAAGLVGDGLIEMEDNLDTFDEKMLLFQKLLPEVMASTRKEVDVTREEWEDAWRDIGEETLPIITDILRNDLLPLLEDFGDWVRNNRKDITKFFEDLGDVIKDAVELAAELKPAFELAAKAAPVVIPVARKILPEIPRAVIGAALPGAPGGPGPAAAGIIPAVARVLYTGANYFLTKDPRERVLGERPFTEEVTAR